MSHSYDKLNRLVPIDQHYLCQNPELDWKFIEQNPDGIKTWITNPHKYYDCNDTRGGYFLARDNLTKLGKSKEFYGDVEYYEYNIKTREPMRVSKNDFCRGTAYISALNEMMIVHTNNNLDFYLNHLYKTPEFNSYVSQYMPRGSLNFNNSVYGANNQFLRNLAIDILNKVPGILENLLAKDELWNQKFKNLNKQFIDNVFIIAKWPTSDLSKNPSLQWEFVLNHIQGFDSNGWNLDMICSNMTLNANFYDYVKLHPKGLCNKKWPLFSLLMNKTLDWSFIDKNLHIFKESVYAPGWGWEHYIFLNPSLRWSFVYKYPDGINGLMWDMRLLCSNSNLGEDFWAYVCKNKNGLFGKFNVYPWNIDALSSNTSLPWSFVLNNPQGLNGKMWNIENLCKNNGLDKDFFEYVANNDTFFDTAWDYDALCKNTSKHLIPVLFHKFCKKLSPSNIGSLLWNEGSKKYIKEILFEFFKDKYFTLMVDSFRYVVSSNEYLMWDDFIKVINDETCEELNILDRTGLLKNNSVTKDPRFWNFVKDNPNGFYLYKTQCEDFKIKWCIDEIESCPNFDWTLLEKFPNGFNSQKWHMGLILSNPSLSGKIINNHPSGINGEMWDSTIWKLPLINEF